MRAAQISPKQSLDFLKLMAHHIRWRILLALAQSDCQVHELVKLTRQSPNLISYHLKQLREQRLISERRSTADARDIYYSLDLDKMRSLYLATGQVLHPSLGNPPQDLPLQTDLTARVLFLCTHNSARSQMAEGILRHLGGGKVEVFSAGSEPTTVDPDAVRALARMNIDISQQHAKHFDQFRGQAFDYIITVCDRVREVCPVFPDDPKQIHWSFPDPADTPGGSEVRLHAFEQTAQQLVTRIHYLLMFIRRDQEKR